MVRTPAFQAGDDGFEPHRSYCGHRTMVVRQIVALPMGGDSPWSPHGWVCLVARAADCKSVTKKHRRFESCPIHFLFASGFWCHPAKVVRGNAPKVRILLCVGLFAVYSVVYRDKSHIVPSENLHSVSHLEIVAPPASHVFHNAHADFAVFHVLNHAGVSGTVKKPAAFVIVNVVSDICQF